MLNFFNRQVLLQLVLSVALFAYVAFTIFTQLTVLPAQGQPMLYAQVVDFFHDHILLCKVLALLMVALETVFIQSFYLANKFCENKSYMPMLTFLSVVSTSGMLTVFTPAWFTLFFLSFIMIYNTYNQHERPNKNKTLAVGVVIAVASLFDFHAAWLLIFLVGALATNQFSKFKDFLILLAGGALVYVYLFTFHFLRDSLHELSLSYAHYHFFEVIKTIKSLEILDYALMAFLILSLPYIVTSMKLYYDNKLIVLRKRYNITIIMVVVLLVMMLFSGITMRQGLVYLIIPMSLFYSMLSIVKKRRLFHDLLFVATLVLLCL